MTSKIQSQNILNDISNSTSNKKYIGNSSLNINSIKNINNNEDKENIKSFNNKEFFTYEDEYIKNPTKTNKNLSKRSSSDSTLVKNNSPEQARNLKFHSSIENNKTNNKDKITTNKNKKDNIKQNNLLKHNSTSSFKTAYSSSSDSTENTFRTTKTSSSQIFENSIILDKSLNIDNSLNLNNSKIIDNSQNEINDTLKVPNLTNKNSGKSVKIYHVTKEKGYDINASTSSLGKKLKSKNSSKEFATSSQYIPNHLMLSENNSKTSFKKEEITQKLSNISITKSHSLKKQSKAIENIIGTPIKKDHVHYILMLDMLNGIRYSVQRCNASTNRELYLKDFKAKHKIALDVYNNELLPSSKYYYKFKDYAPRVFRSIREIFKISSEDYL
eukprot:jgi/Orpsp1_1/1180271/evm.model.c7180000072739.1